MTLGTEVPGLTPLGVTEAGTTAGTAAGMTLGTAGTTRGYTAGTGEVSTTLGITIIQDGTADTGAHITQDGTAAGIHTGITATTICTTTIITMESSMSTHGGADATIQNQTGCSPAAQASEGASAHHHPHVATFLLPRQRAPAPAQAAAQAA